MAVVIFGETVIGGLKVEIGQASDVRLSSMGMAVPSITYSGTYAYARGNGGPLHVVFENYKKPAPVIPVPIFPSATSAQELCNFKTLAAAMVHMLGGAVVIHSHEFEKAIDMELTSHYDDLSRITIAIKGS